ncbi:late competence development ComFB family protein [Paenibacillus thermotolerans]|uniref:late competence development ComFB family protein n=1 Tax=Paenibacillus thermotolerans TaxID=3027807 RepID=UPI0023683915|nr:MULTISPECIES: late competence development ComFB family protein [unclassified Paenibacillus]
MAVHNLMEDIVKSCLKEMAATQPILTKVQPKLLDDMVAIALNRLPPRYVATERGEVIAKTQLRAQVESDVYKELTAAMNKVLNSPDRK